MIPKIPGNSGGDLGSVARWEVEGPTRGTSSSSVVDVARDVDAFSWTRTLDRLSMPSKADCCVEFMVSMQVFIEKKAVSSCSFIWTPSKDIPLTRSRLRSLPFLLRSVRTLPSSPRQDCSSFLAHSLSACSRNTFSVIVVCNAVRLLAIVRENPLSTVSKLVVRL